METSLNALVAFLAVVFIMAGFIAYSERHPNPVYSSFNHAINADQHAPIDWVAHPLGTPVK